MTSEQEVDQLASKVIEEADEVLVLAMAIADLQARVKAIEQKLALGMPTELPASIREAMQELAAAR